MPKCTLNGIIKYIYSLPMYFLKYILDNISIFRLKTYIKNGLLKNKLLQCDANIL